MPSHFYLLGMMALRLSSRFFRSPIPAFQHDFVAAAATVRRSILEDLADDFYRLLNLRSRDIQVSDGPYLIRWRRTHAQPV